MRDKLSILFLAGMCFMSCKEPVSISVVIDRDVNIHVMDKAGENLLNPSNPKAFKSDSIKIYYLVDGKKKEIYRPDATYPRDFFVTKNESNGEYYAHVFVNGGTKDKEVTTTYIQWNATTVDTLETLISRTSNLTICYKVVYNGKLMFDMQDHLDTAWGNEHIDRLLHVTH